MLFDYDCTSPESILSYAKALEGHTYLDILKRYLSYYDKLGEFNDDSIQNTKAKGQLGNFLEEYYFGYQPNGNQDRKSTRLNSSH